MIMTLREVCSFCGVSRRAVQGYEKMGLAVPSGKTSIGYLQYDEIQQARIAEIKKWQDIGFSLKEIKELIDANPRIKKKAIELQIHKLEEEKKRIDALIQMAMHMIDKSC